jgi:S1-C subfamily serine protease
MNGEPVLVTVLTNGVDPARPTLRLGSRPVAARAIGHDPVSRLGFLQSTESTPVKSLEWLESLADSKITVLNANSPAGVIRCRTDGWVKQVGTKVLPLALLKVIFDQSPPPPGTPLLAPGGAVAALFFQDSGTANTGYAIPAEAVHRVRRDVSNGGHLIRGWLGLSLLAENPSPKIVRILANSPAAAVGIRPGDVLVQVGKHRVADYADAANAFFYLIPGQSVRLEILRGTSNIAFNVTPTRAQAE